MSAYDVRNVDITKVCNHDAFWRCVVCRELIMPYELHEHPTADFANAANPVPRDEYGVRA